MKRYNDNDVEIINGKKFINGFLCNDQGQPITVKNGYSQEDEEYAQKIYDELKRNQGLER